MPISMRRVTADGASVVCRVDSTRCPVRAACVPIWAVSRSRISPTSTMSGSWRRIDRRARGNVRPARKLIATWLIPGRWYSTGSSTVIALTLAALSWFSVAPGVVAPALPRQLLQHAVAAVPHPQRIRLGFEVQVAGPILHALSDERVHELPDRRVLGRARAGVGVGDLLLGHALEGLVDGVAHAGVPVDGLGDALRGADRGLDLEVGDVAGVVDGEHVRGVAHGDDQRA